jgi:glycogen synthase
LKILFIVHDYFLHIGVGGIESYVACIAPALAARGHEVHVLSCVAGQTSTNALEAGVYVHYRGGPIPIRGLWRINRRLVRALPKTIWRFENGLRAYFEARQLEVNFDVIEYPDWGAMGCVFALLHPKPLVAHHHNPPPSVYTRYYEVPRTRDNRWANALAYFSVRHADAITAPSSFLVRALQDEGWLRGCRIAVIPQPIDWLRWGKAQQVRETPPNVVFLGRLERNKAPELVAEAISLIRRELPDAEALFVGKSSGKRDGRPYLEWLQRSPVAGLGCEFLGEMPRHELVSVFSRSRVLAQPSWFENYSMAALEAMAAGRPVVVTATSGIAELVEQTGAGRIVPPGDPKALAEALWPFLRDPAYAAAVGTRARAAVQERLSPDQIAVQRETIYREALDSFKRRHPWQSN